MTEPKNCASPEVRLLTESEARSLLMSLGNGWTVDDQITHLRERGLIAPEPVDPLRLLAVQIVDYLNPQGDEQDINWIVNTILRPGIDALELGERPTLTWKMVREACNAAYKGWLYTDDFVDALHAALLERLNPSDGTSS